MSDDFIKTFNNAMLVPALILLFIGVVIIFLYIASGNHRDSHKDWKSKDEARKARQKKMSRLSRVLRDTSEGSGEERSILTQIESLEPTFYEVSELIEGCSRKSSREFWIEIRKEIAQGNRSESPLGKKNALD